MRYNCERQCNATPLTGDQPLRPFAICYLLFLERCRALAYLPRPGSLPTPPYLVKVGTPVLIEGGGVSPQFVFGAA
jgi:hypothetical protein